MALNFNRWMIRYHKRTEAQLTEKNVMKWFGVDKEEANGLIQNYHDEYGDYLEGRGQWESEKGYERLDNFLERWKERAYEYYINLCEERNIEYDKKYEVTAENLKLITGYKWGYREHQRTYNDEEVEKIMENIKSGKMPTYQIDNLKCSIHSQMMKIWKEKHNKTDLIIVDKISCYGWQNYEKRDELLNRILDREVEARRKQFISKIEKVAGKIKDLSGIESGVDGSINGMAVGEICKARVLTIYAGGYNIQCLHYRVLVNKIK